MNPFLNLIFLIPLIVSLLLLVGSFIGLILTGPRWDIILSILIFGVISSYLIFALRKASTREGSLIKFPGSNAVNESTRRKITTVYLSAVYLGLFSLALILFNFKSLRNWLGIGGFVLGLAFLFSGISLFRSARSLEALTSESAAQNRLHLLKRSISVNLKRRNYILIINAFAGIILVWFYLFYDGALYFSVLDLFGFIFFLSSFCVWFVLHGKSMQQGGVGPSERFDRK